MLLGEPYLDLQDVVAAHALVVHVVVCVIRIAAILVLHESKPENDSQMLQRLSSSGGATYNLLLADRGAGMSQRTSRP
jgi:hypothetical protein